jgi:alpha-L-fucosidase
MKALFALLPCASLAIAVVPSRLADQDPPRVLKLEGQTHHVQGILADGGRLYLTSVDRDSKKGWLLEFDLATGKRLRAKEIQQGDMFHPGGFDADAESLWIPVAEYRPASRAVIQRRSKKTLELISSFEAPDHIGCIARTPEGLIGGNWDSRKFYTWTTDGAQRSVVDNPHALRIQDMKYRDGLIVAAGYGEPVLWLNPATLAIERHLDAESTPAMDFSHGVLRLVKEGAPTEIREWKLLGNKPERLEWFRDLGFGMFIHWNVDVTLGSVISHSLVGATQDYVKRYFEILPRYLTAEKFNPVPWARLAKMAGMKYVVFTTKHHAGFAWWDTRTTPFNVMNTPLKRDVVRAIVDAFRAEGIAIGFYISPDDFWWFHQNGYPIARPPAPQTTTREIPALMEYGKRQIRELFTNYGKIDVLFIDGPADGLREEAWRIQPDVVVTRGAIDTPEQHVPGIPMDVPWEACITIGDAWQHKPADQPKTSQRLLEMLIEIRAKGGNLLLNVGPRPDGELSPGEEARLRDIALWNFAFGESLDSVRPWVITNENNIWFTRHKSGNAVYAFVTQAPWKMGERREIVLKSVRATANTTVSILSQSDQILEYRPDVIPKTTWEQKPDGLHISAMTAQRFYDDRRWTNPIVLKITNAEAALKPPVVETLPPREGRLAGELKSLGDAAQVEVGFEYRPRRGITDLYEKTEPWIALPLAPRTAAGVFTAPLPQGVDPAAVEYRAVVRHPLLMLYGAERPAR